MGCSSVLGLRKQNEDRLRVARLQDNLLYFAIFDGHGGPHAADFCYTFMEKFIRLVVLNILISSNSVVLELLTSRQGSIVKVMGELESVGEGSLGESLMN